MGKSQPFPKSSSVTTELYPVMKPCAFYLGQLINLCGIIVFFVGISSNAWVTVDASSSRFPESKKLEMVAKYGPWEACTHGGRCDAPWVILAGIGDNLTRIVQMLMALAVIFYAMGLAVMILQMLIPKTIARRLWHSLDSLIVVEFIVPFAAVTAFIAMLTMGELKRKVIIYGHQTQSAGYGFFVTMIAIILTITGSVCMILNRYAVAESRMSRYIVKWRRLRRNLRRRRRRRGHHADSKSSSRKVDASDVDIFMTGRSMGGGVVATVAQDHSDQNTDKDAGGDMGGGVVATVAQDPSDQSKDKDGGGDTCGGTIQDVCVDTYHGDGEIRKGTPRNEEGRERENSYVNVEIGKVVAADDISSLKATAETKKWHKASKWIHFPPVLKGYNSAVADIRECGFCPGKDNRNSTRGAVRRLTSCAIAPGDITTRRERSDALRFGLDSAFAQQDIASPGPPVTLTKSYISEIATSKPGTNKTRSRLSHLRHIHEPVDELRLPGNLQSAAPPNNRQTGEAMGLCEDRSNENRLYNDQTTVTDNSGVADVTRKLQDKVTALDWVRENQDNQIYCKGYDDAIGKQSSDNLYKREQNIRRVSIPEARTRAWCNVDRSGSRDDSSTTWQSVMEPAVHGQKDPQKELSSSSPIDIEKTGAGDFSSGCTVVKEIHL